MRSAELYKIESDAALMNIRMDSNKQYGRYRI
jgi:hypothetical protein